MHTQEAFAPDGRSASEARRFVRRTLEGWGAPDLTDEAVLVTSELVTNAVVHAGTPVRVALDLDAQALRIEVQDLHPHRSLPLGAEAPEDDAEHGRGLLITAALASSWGVDYSAGAKRVWLRFERGSGTVRAAAQPRRRAARRTSTGDLLVGVVELSADDRVTSWNPDAERLLGWTSSEVVGRLWAELVSPSDGRSGWG
ncbi:MAG: ATP-binding protein, partial [Nocardioidaceae bacterium]